MTPTFFLHLSNTYVSFLPEYTKLLSSIKLFAQKGMVVYKQTSKPAYRNQVATVTTEKWDVFLCSSLCCRNNTYFFLTVPLSSSHSCLPGNQTDLHPKGGKSRVNGQAPELRFHTARNPIQITHYFLRVKQCDWTVTSWLVIIRAEKKKKKLIIHHPIKAL